jgi:uncharacterized protein DUF2530
MPPPRRPDPEPLETDDVKVVVVGTAVWFVALVLTTVFHSRLADDGRGDWVWIALAGFLLGLVALRHAVRRRAAMRRDAAATATPRH